MEKRLIMVNRQRIRGAMDLEIRPGITARDIDCYIAYQRVLDDFCDGTVPPDILIEQLSGDGLIDIDRYLENLSYNLRCL